ncbi:ATP-binding cassette domain-containing protein [Ramlibacter sp.]|uniref:energy-coupling factor ABC transporter ATP-binding protein n=1 Tax=Ramlibacter sp. TaxID=1917967 RepID=UPI0017BE044E|nr:ATP-binding cassette domain-containing protein [Ramlibacter sp.]MBA2673893.1 ATP-binding cassette domain-containing protein [Ramlibacter sp.]
MIEIFDVSLRYDGLSVLRNIDLTLSQRRIAIVGSNGSGKSSFARLLNGLQLPTEGTVRVDGFDTRKDGKQVRKKVGFVFQNPDNQIVFPVVDEDLAFGLKNLKLAPDVIEQKVTEVLGRYDLLAFRKHSSHHLSGGQKQLVAISGVLAMEPAYIVMDEPTTLLDLRNKRRIAQVIDALEQTAIVVSHDLDFLRGFDRVIAFEDGRVVIDDTPSPALARYVERLS